MPDTTPLVLTVATLGLLVLYVPPALVPFSVMLLPTHTALAPVKVGTGNAFTVIVTLPVSANGSLQV